MPKQTTSQQIAAHLTQSYMENGKDADILQDFSQTLEKRVRTLKKEGDRQLYQDMGSLLYCVRDLRGSCRDTAESVLRNDPKNTRQDLDRSALRVREIGQLLVDIRQAHPQEYEKSCKEFTDSWRSTEFEKGDEVLRMSGLARPVRQKSEAPKETVKNNAGPVPGL